MPSGQVRRKDNTDAVRHMHQPKLVFGLPKDAEEQSRLAQIERWLELADVALATPKRRKSA